MLEAMRAWNLVSAGFLPAAFFKGLRFPGVVSQEVSELGGQRGGLFKAGLEPAND